MYQTGRKGLKIKLCSTMLSVKNITIFKITKTKLLRSVSREEVLAKAKFSTLLRVLFLLNYKRIPSSLVLLKSPNPTLVQKVAYNLYVSTQKGNQQLLNYD